MCSVVISTSLVPTGLEKGDENMLNMTEILNEMEEERKYRKSQLPPKVRDNLAALLEDGLVVKTGNRGGTKYHMSHAGHGLLARNAQKRPTKAKFDEPHEKPAWVEAAETVVEENAEVVTEEADAGELPATALTSFSLVIGNRAALIVQMCDGLNTGQIGLGAINDIKGQALLMLRDLNLIEV